MSGMFFRKLLRIALVALRMVPKPRFVTRVTDRQPGAKQLESGEVVAVRGARGPKWACLLCPCGSGEVVRLALDRDTRPFWNLKVDRLGRPTLSPSIWQLDGCRCHFWIRRGEITWCGNADE